MFIFVNKKNYCSYLAYYTKSILVRSFGRWRYIVDYFKQGVLVRNRLLSERGTAQNVYHLLKQV